MQPERDRPQRNRRRDARVAVAGNVLIRGAAVGHGRILNLSSGGVYVRWAAADVEAKLGERVDVDLHVDRTGACWLSCGGRILRADDHHVAIQFCDVPIELGAVISDAVLSVIEGAHVRHVLLVDADGERRASLAALLRRGSDQVFEATTPLEAIAHLGASPIRTWVVAIHDSLPETVADELRSFLSDADEPVEVVSLGTLAPAIALARLQRVQGGSP